MTCSQDVTTPEAESDASTADILQWQRSELQLLLEEWATADEVAVSILQVKSLMRQMTQNYRDQFINESLQAVLNFVALSKQHESSLMPPPAAPQQQQQGQQYQQLQGQQYQQYHHQQQYQQYPQQQKTYYPAAQQFPSSSQLDSDYVMAMRDAQDMNAPVQDHFNPYYSIQGNAPNFIMSSPVRPYRSHAPFASRAPAAATTTSASAPDPPPAAASTSTTQLLQ